VPAVLCPVFLIGPSPGALPAGADPCDDLSGDLDRVRIFVVEDDALSAIMLNDLLEMWGFQVSGIAGNAPAAIREIERQRPDIVLMDIRLAGNTDGVAAAQEIRRRFGIRSVFVTAYTDRATLDRVREAEPLGFLTKPYSPGQLQETLTQALDRLRAC
jgi:CheY-like chemotaxis protein